MTSERDTTQPSRSSTQRWFMLALLALSGATVYTFPFLRYSYYEPLQSALGVTHTQMGVLQSLNGILSTLGYIPGGWLADRYSPRLLLSVSLISTGLSGFYFSTFPSYIGAMFLYGFWGISTLVIFWAPLIKATRELGSKEEQGKLFGFLEGGRGVFAFLIGALTLVVFSRMGESEAGLMWVINISAVITVTSGLAVWLFFEDSEPQAQSNAMLDGIMQAVRMPATWMIAVIIFCGYSLFAGQSYITPYMTEVLGASLTMGALMGLIRTYGLQTLGGLGAAVLATRIGSPNKLIVYAFCVTTMCMGVFVMIPASATMMNIVTVNMVILGLAVYVIRGNYYALVGESDMPIQITGAIVGVSSFIGFMPEAFIYPLIGNWLDTYPGEAGYKITFSYLLATSVVGLCMSIALLRRNSAAKKLFSEEPTSH
ncbi:MAG: nitrate/nitrite transporter [Pseudomonadales bacterium]